MCCAGRSAGDMDSHIERLILLPCALTLRVPRRASEDLGVAGLPIVWDGDHDVVLQTPQE